MRANQWNTLFDEEINQVRSLVAAHLDQDGHVTDFIVGVQCWDALKQPYWKQIDPHDHQYRWVMQYAVLRLAGLSMRIDDEPIW